MDRPEHHLAGVAAETDGRAVSRFEGLVPDDLETEYEDVSEVTREDWRDYCRLLRPHWTTEQCDADYNKYIRKVRRK